jgi:hypothetical protein
MAYEVALGASGIAISWMALRPLKFVCTIDTFFPSSRSTLCAASGAARRTDKDAQITVTAERKRVLMSYLWVSESGVRASLEA